ncbi:MAG: tetratricopeptide repeat protein [Candidatus Manganitrophus sp. SA1]|nr:tetratricopeptide repeat protein [Candidatus Manganitrophus morganii]
MGKASQRDTKEKSRPSPQAADPPRRYFLTRPPVVFVFLSLLAGAIYSNSFSVPFLFDDLRNIVENPRIKDFKNFLDFSGTRYIGFLSFALNYYFGKLNPFGYHLVNLFIHIVNGFLVYLLALLLFRSSRIADPGVEKQAPWMAVVTSLLFIAHPIQTQAVTYIVQRFASLATLFYLSAVVCYLKWRLSDSKSGIFTLTGAGWYGAALLSTVLAMKTKEISFTLPVMIILIEAVFFRKPERKRWIFLVPFLLTLLIIPLSRIDVAGGAGEGFARETTTLSRSEYLFTEFRVILTYIRLLFLPVGQNLDYDYPIYHSIFEPPALLSFLFLFALFGLSLFLLLISSSPIPRLFAFGVLWFFLTLSVESSIIPIRDVIFEHRLYLPSVGFFFSCAMALLIGFRYLKSGPPGIYRPALTVSILSFIVISLSLATYQRNMVWRDKIGLWEDVVKKSPRKGRAHDNLGSALSERGDFQGAIAHFSQALGINPEDANAHNSLGVTLDRQGKFEEALGHYLRAVEIKPKDETTHYNLGDALQKRGRLEEAIHHYFQALRIRPDFDKVHNNLGVALGRQGKFEDAVFHLSKAARITPNDAMTQYNLGTILFQQGNFEEAVVHLSRAAQMSTDDAMARYDLGRSYWKLGRSEDSVRELEAALRIDPKFSEARESLEAVRRGAGKSGDQ